MEKIVLYRKHRPTNFDEVLGQEHITKVLLGAINLGNISHSYLFFGSRGTGKTSVARILAKQIGCSENDLYEIDAASNRGIDDIRELRDSVNISPFESPFKVYIIDEVHMLTKEAFNALLKTLEEPPKHIVFILATTEIEKLPETIVSRCQTFNFKKPSQAVLKEMILNVAKKENFQLEMASAELISLLGDGSFRDALGILQKVIGSSADAISSKQIKKITAEEIEIILDAPKSELVNDFIYSIADLEIEKGLNALNKANENNVNLKIFSKLVLNKLRAILILRYSKEMKEIIQKEFSEKDFEFVKKLAEEKDSKISSQTIKSMLEASEQIGKAYLPQLPLELFLIKLV